MELKIGIKQTIDDAINIGKSAMGIFTGNFENIGQMQKAIQKGGLIDGMSSLIDVAIDGLKNTGIIDNKILKIVKQGKNIILNNLESNISNTFNNQYQIIENTNKYISNWKKHFENKDFEGMEKEFNKIEKQFKNIAPIENTINNMKTVEILHNLIKNNGHDFNLSNEQLELAQKLV